MTSYVGNLDGTGAMRCVTTLSGLTDNGTSVGVPVTPEGHLEVAIHDPISAFGEVLTVTPWPVFQGDGVYGINTNQLLSTTYLGGTTSGADSSLVASTTTAAGSYGVLQSRRRVRYRPGQGVSVRFTAAFTTGVAGSYQVVGLGHSEDGVFFGYDDLGRFGILHSSRQTRAIYTLTVTVGATVAETIIVTLNGTANNVAVTNSANVYRTAYEISSATYIGWQTHLQGATVVFVRASAGATAGAFTITNFTGAFAGNIVQTRAGLSTPANDVWVPQTSWNGDNLLGSGASGITLDPTKLNVYEIKMQYLGAGAIAFRVEVAPPGTNTPTWVTVHTLKFPNTRTQTTFGIPSFPFTLSAYNLANNTTISTTCGSYAAFLEGEKKLVGYRSCYYTGLTNVDATNFRVLFLLQNSRVFQTKVNQTSVGIISAGGACQHNFPVQLFLFRSPPTGNLQLSGNPNLVFANSNSCVLSDTTTTTLILTVTSSDQLIWVGSMGSTGNVAITFDAFMEDLNLQPGEMLALCAKASQGTPSQVVGNVVIREDV